MHPTAEIFIAARRQRRSFLAEYMPFDLWIEGQNCSSGSFDDLSELWEFLVYVGAWH